MYIINTTRTLMLCLETWDGRATANEQSNKVFQPIFYKGTTFANYKEAMHVLSSNNCVLMDDLFGNQSTKAKCDALVAKKIDDEIGIESDENQLY